MVFELADILISRPRRVFVGRGGGDGQGHNLRSHAHPMQVHPACGQSKEQECQRVADDLALDRPPPVAVSTNRHHQDRGMRMERMNTGNGAFLAGRGRHFCRGRSASDEEESISYRQARRGSRCESGGGCRRLGMGAIMLVSALLAAGCGQKGPLHLPRDQAQIRSTSAADPALQEDGVSEFFRSREFSRLARPRAKRSLGQGTMEGTQDS